MKKGESQVISMLKLRHELTNITNDVIFGKKEFIVIKNRNNNLAFCITPLQEKQNLKKISAQIYWESLIDRSKIGQNSLEKIRIREKRKRKY